jgi:hypothetical protein
MVGVTVAALLLAMAAAVPPCHAQTKPVARLENRAVTESSGIVASRKNPGIYWTHNDSGDGAYLYAFDREGRDRGRWTVRGATAIDWEDIAIAQDAKSGCA